MNGAIALAACMAVVAAACGGSDSDSTEAAPAETEPVATAPADTTPAEDPEPEPTTAPEPEPVTTTTTEPPPELNVVGRSTTWCTT